MVQNLEFKLAEYIKKVEVKNYDYHIGTSIRESVVEFINWTYPAFEYNKKVIDLKEYGYRIEVDIHRDQKSINIVKVFKLENNKAKLLFKVHPNLNKSYKDRIELA